MIKLICGDCNTANIPETANAVFSDFVYEDPNFSFIDRYWEKLAPGGVYIAMTDFHTIFELGCFMKTLPDAYLINHLVWKNEWGNHPKDRFHQCFDDILIFSKGKQHKFYSDRVQVPKATAKTKLNPSGRPTKTATAWIEDICLTTTSPERVKQEDGHLVRWQKPVDLMHRIFTPFTDPGDLIIDTHMGSGTLGEWCRWFHRGYIGIEKNADVFYLAQKRLDKTLPYSSHKTSVYADQWSVEFVQRDARPSLLQQGE